MRRSADWMVLVDDRILEYLEDTGDSVTGTELENTGEFSKSRSYLSRRLHKLADADLVNHLGNGVFVLTEKGEGYLNEEYHVEKAVYLNEDQADDGGPTAGEGVGEL